MRHTAIKSHSRHWPFCRWDRIALVVLIFTAIRFFRFHARFAVFLLISFFSHLKFICMRLHFKFVMHNNSTWASKNADFLSFSVFYRLCALCSVHVLHCVSVVAGKKSRLRSFGRKFFVYLFFIAPFSVRFAITSREILVCFRQWALCVVALGKGRSMTLSTTSWLLCLLHTSLSLRSPSTIMWHSQHLQRIEARENIPFNLHRKT